MDKSASISRAARMNFFLNLINAAPFLIVMISGLALQVNYHMHRLPDEALVSGLSRSGWLLLHKTSAALSLAGIIAHCVTHRKQIGATTRRIIKNRSFSKIMASYYLLLICIPTAFTAIGSWLLFNPGDASRRALVEIHDKLGLVLVIVSTVHILSRTGWMIKTGNRLMTR